uniref:Kinesin-like protein K39 n=1 Tax=Elaeis guineensis var. tenera TaxID=51953 RepID=A0A6I9Q9J8_ELAGV|nr:kinesin-like protein K39 [Elaeis guineensis]
MATGEPQKQLLSLIRDFIAEKSHGERRVSDLKKRLLELQTDLDAANADLEAAKRSKEVSEQELRGSQVLLSMVDASIKAREARIFLLQEKISKVGSDLDALKAEENVQRDEFISTMNELNVKIRQFQEMVIHDFQKQLCSELSSDNDRNNSCNQVLDVQDALKDLRDRIECINAQMHKSEDEHQKELHYHDEVSKELAIVKRRGFLLEAIMGETKLLQELAGQTNELEKAYASAGEELQRRYICPRCGFNNMGDLGGTEAIDNN